MKTINAHCKKCGKPFTSIGNAEYCISCHKEIGMQKKIDWLTERRWDEEKGEEYTLEERVAWIEEWIYENKPLSMPRDIPLF